MIDHRLNPAFATDEFLQQYWQKKPVLLPNLIPDFADFITAEELAGLACEELVESRLVTEFEKGNWQLSHGPFIESDFTKLASSNWTLLVQAVDQWVDEIADLKRLFEFIPNWRIDDIMVSFAAAGGSVGPHYDFYDVFLLQGSGRRNWKVGARCESDVLLVQNSELRLLENFEASMEFDLSPGDALYIPPRYAHWGVATTDSLCYSIGFRAPSLAEMVEGFSDFLIKGQDPAQRYEDSKIEGNLRSGEISSTQLDKSFQQLTQRFSEKEKFVAWFGCYVSQPKYPELIEPQDEEFSPAELASLLREGVILRKNPSSRFAFTESDNAATVFLFVDGSMVAFPLQQIDNIVTLCEVAELTLDESAPFVSDPEMVELLRRLLNQGSLLLTQ